VSAYLKIIIAIIDAINRLSAYMAKKHNVAEVDSVIKAIDSNDDVALANQLHALADKVAERKKTT